MYVKKNIIYNIDINRLSNDEDISPLIDNPDSK